MKPENVNILGINYKISYVDNPADVHLYKREALWGEIDYWTRTIRIFDNGRSIEDTWGALIEEILHGICQALKMDDLNNNEDHIGLLALGLSDVLFRNKFIKINVPIP